MNFGGKMPIGMICPNCLEYGHHPTTATEPKWYIYNDSATKLFKSELGRDICYRIRHKTCTECAREFQTVEMGRIFLDFLIESALRTEQSEEAHKATVAELSALQTRYESAKQTLESIQNIVSPKPEKRKRRRKK
jgi:hypothetical protein